MIGPRRRRRVSSPPCATRVKAKHTRDALLAHYAREAAVQAAHALLRTKTARARAERPWRKVLSDVDDTLTCGYHYPAGCDQRFPRKTLYPGVLALYRELDLGAHGPDQWGDGRLGNLAFMSARPHVYRDLSENFSYQKFKKLAMHRGLHAMPTMLTGDLGSGAEFMLNNDFEPLAAKKFQNFLEFQALYPEFSFVFVCDNGQGDVRAAEMMIAACPDKVEAVYVHLVVPLERTHGYRDAQTPARITGSDAWAAVPR